MRKTSAAYLRNHLVGRRSGIVDGRDDGHVRGKELHEGIWVDEDV